jgi:arginase family enzyme
MEYAAAAEKLLALELVEVNPDLDRNFATVNAAIGLLEVALGATII